MVDGALATWGLFHLTWVITVIGGLVTGPVSVGPVFQIGYGTAVGLLFLEAARRNISVYGFFVLILVEIGTLIQLVSRTGDGPVYSFAGHVHGSLVPSVVLLYTVIIVLLVTRTMVLLDDRESLWPRTLR